MRADGVWECWVDVLQRQHVRGVTERSQACVGHLFFGLGCDVKSNQTVESTSYGESHGGAVQ